MPSDIKKGTEMEKIGILTFTSNFNMGSFWQAYATQQMIKSAFPNSQIKIINYHREIFRESVGYDKWVIFKKRHVNLFHLYRDIMGRKKYRECQKRYLDFDVPKGFYTNNIKEALQFINDQRYDSIFIGSDEVLKFDERNYLENTLPVYWLPETVNATKFLIAASVGTKPPDLDRLSLSLKNKLINSLSEFELLGVRDELTYETVCKLIQNYRDRLFMIPDPTFSLSVDTLPAEIYLKNKGLDLSRPIIGIDLLLSLPGLNDYINKLKKQGNQVVAWRMGPRKEFIDCSDIDPIQWSGMFKFFSLTITNRFHASIFCLKNLVPVLAIDCHPGRFLETGWSKTFSLLKRFDLEKTNHTNITRLKTKDDLAMAAGNAIEYFDKSLVEKILNELQNELDNYLAHTVEVMKVK